MKTMTNDAMVIASRQELIDIIKYLVSTNDQLNNTITELTMQLDWLKRQVFGKKSERFFATDEQQMAMDLGIVKNDEQNTPVTTETVTYDRTKKESTQETPKGHGRGKMPTHLPITKKVIEPEGDLSGMVCIGEEVSWYYDMGAPSSLSYCHDGQA